ncbi:MAG TPA: BamA/TamA family outer membrane protein, partial [Myxococcota bacterium]
LVGDASQNLNPTYTSDGSAVLFSSDREGMFSIYAVERGSKTVHRIVDSLGLAKYPRATPDGLGVIYVDTGLDGNDLYAAPLDVAHAPVVERGPPAPPVAELTPESSADTERYNAFGTLLPHYWIPLLATDAAGGPALGAAVVGADAVGQLSFSAQATYGFAIERPHLAATVRFADLYTPISVSGEYRTDRSDAVRRNDGQPEVEQQQVLVGGASVSVPLFRGERFSQGLTLGYARELHIVETPETSAPDAKAPVYPPDANIGAVTLDWSYDGIDAFRDSVSNERGFTSFLHLRHAERLTGSTQDITEAVVDARAFTPVPGLGAHVVGLYLSGGVAIGNPLLRDTFFLGGFQDRDITSDLISGNRSGAGVLRGYPSSAFQGDAFALGTVEYRFPLLEIEHGFATVPIFFDRVHGALFSDLGEAWDGVPNAKKFRASVGVELQLQVTLAYYGLFLVRVGYARGVSQGGVDQPYVVLGFPY